MSSNDPKDTSASATAAQATAAQATTPATTSAPPPAPTAGPRAAPNRARRLGLFGLAAVVVLCALGYGGYWFFDARYLESTHHGHGKGAGVQGTSEGPGT